MKKIVICMTSIILCLFCFSGCAKTVNGTSKKISSYDIVATLNYESKTLSATEKVKYVNTSGQDLHEICFHLYPNAFRKNSQTPVVGALNEKKCYEYGESFGSITINDCKTETITSSFSISGVDENILKISLDTALKNKDKLNITIEFSLIIPNCNHRFGWNDQTINLGNWYPIACVFENGQFVQSPYNSNGDPFYSESANYNVSITAPSNLIVAGTGNKSTKTSGNNTITTFSAKAVRDFAVVLGQFQSIKTKVDGISIYYYYYNDIYANANLETAKKSIATFNDLFGKYPYKTYSVVQTKFVHGGMEFPQLVLISDALKTNEDYQMVIIHETAHQWWYSVIGSNQFDNPWQDEALAEFSTALFYKEHPEYNIDFEKHFDHLVASYVMFEKVYTEILSDLDTSMSRSLDKFNTEPEYTYLTYVKGNIMFKNLYDMMGEKKFLKALKKYYKTNKFGIATPQSLITCFTKYNKTDLVPFFNNWLSGNVNINEL